MIDLEADDILTFQEAATNYRRHLGTIRNWATVGVRGVVLESKRVGYGFVTSAEACEVFFAAIAKKTPPSNITCGKPNISRPRPYRSDELID